MEKLSTLISNSEKAHYLLNKCYAYRLQKELTHIETLGQTDNILRAYYIKQVIESFNVPFFIRGSAGGSLVLYILGFTTIDPLEHGILFERFINEYREVLGDIDFDLPRTMRYQIMKKVFDKFKSVGVKIGRLCTRVFYRKNSALREIIRRHNLRVTIPREIMNDHTNLQNLLAKYSIDYNKVLSEAEKLEGCLRYRSAHVGGLTVLKDDEDWLLPVNIKKTQDVPLVNLDRNDIDSQKRFKIDLLSNTGLDIIREVYPCSQLDEKTFPYKQEVFDMIGRGDVIGIVYGESPLVKNTFKIYHDKKGIKSVQDIAKCISLIRPMARGNGKDSDLIFDDDWIVELAKLLDISYAEADKQRKRLAKDDDKLLSKLKSLVSISRLKQLMQIKQYGFCKAHAMNYAQLIYCQAYAKFYKPAEFYCAVFNNLNGRIYKDWVYFFDALKHNIKLFATRKNDKYITKGNKIIPKNGIQIRFIPLTVHQELREFGGITSLKDIEKLNGLVACSRVWKDTEFRTCLRNGEMIDEVSVL